MVLELLTGPDVLGIGAGGVVAYLLIKNAKTSDKVAEMSILNSVGTMITNALNAFKQSQTDTKQSEAIAKNELALAGKVDKP